MGINPNFVRFQHHIVPPGNRPIHQLLGNFHPALLPRRPRRRGRSPSPINRRVGRRPDGGIPIAQYLETRREGRRTTAAGKIQRSFKKYLLRKTITKRIKKRRRDN